MGRTFSGSLISGHSLFLGIVDIPAGATPAGLQDDAVAQRLPHLTLTAPSRTHFGVDLA